MSTGDQVDFNDTVSKTDDEKVNDTDIEKGAKTDDQKLDEDGKTQGSPEPEYTPPDSSASWSTVDEANASMNKPPTNSQTDNEKALTSEKNTEGEAMADNEGKPSEETANEVKDNTDPESTAENTDKTETAENTEQMENEPENKTEQEANAGDAQDSEPTAENKDDQETETSEQTAGPPDVKDEKEEEAVEEEQKEDKVEPEETEVTSKEKEAELSKAKEESLIAKEQLDKKIKENEELQQELKSALSNQETESESYKKLTEENAKLQKHYDDVKEKYDEMEGGHVLLVAELETVKKVNAEQKETIQRLEAEVKYLKETQGGDEVVKDLQDKLIRLSNEQEEKDRKIHSLEGELDATREKLKDAETNAARNGGGEPPKSKTCIIM